MIIAHVLLNTPTLKTCSATCRSWYITTLPHLHHTLTLRQWASDSARRGLKPLRKLGKMRLLPLVIRLRNDLSWSFAAPQRVINSRSPVTSPCLRTSRNSQSTRWTSVASPRRWNYTSDTSHRNCGLSLSTTRRCDLLSFIGLFLNLDNFKLRYDRTDERILGICLFHNPRLPCEGV